MKGDAPRGVASDLDLGGAFFMIQGIHLRWGLPTQRILRIASEGEPELPPSLPLPSEFLPFDDSSLGRWTLILDTRDGPRAVLVSRFLELVPADQVNLQPLPALCQLECTSEPSNTARVTHIALAQTGDDVLFLLVDPLS